MPGNIDQLKSSNQITQSLLRQCMQEAKHDPAQMQQLQTVIDAKQQTDFVDPKQYDQVVQFLLDYNSSKFEVRPNRTNSAPRPATIDEARITKVFTTQVNMNPPAPVGRYRDPLNITGKAEAGARVEFYNASRPGRPPLGETLAGPNGKFTFELTDEALFKYGDQIGVRVVDASGNKSKAKIVPTEPFRVDQQVNAANPSQVVSIRHSALPRQTDDENPFYQDNLVRKEATPPAQLGEPWTLQLKGGDDSVEPNSKISVTINGETFHTTADDDGMFALKVRGFNPGQRLTLRIEDLNGRGFDLQYQTDPVRLDMAMIGAAVGAPPSLEAPRNMPVVGNAGGPFIPFEANGVAEPNGAVVIRNRTTGDVFEVPADKNGNVRAALGGIGEFDVLEIATRDVNGNFSPNTEWATVLPEKLAKQKGFLTPVAAFDKQSTADVQSVIESIKGPPVDVIKNGAPDPRGPFLRMPDVNGLPPFGQLAVVRDGEVIQTLRADKDGCLHGVLAGVHVGDQLNFRVLDAAGRRFPGEFIGWNVPDDKKTSKVAGMQWTSDDRTLKDCLGKVGTGDLTLDHAWTQPFTILATGAGPIAANVRLHYPLETFGGQKRAQETADQINYIPVGIGQKMGVNGNNPYELRVIEQNGTQRIEVNTIQKDQRGGVSRSSPHAVFGFDVVLGQLNLGDPNNPMVLGNPTTPQQQQQFNYGLTQLQQLLKFSLAFVATAYDQGKEPGDVAYDKPMQMVKTALYAFDKLAKDNPTQADNIKKMANDAWPKDGFPFELISKERVPQQAADATAGVSGKKTATMSLIDAVQAMKAGTEVGNEAGGNAPRVDSAIILRPSQGASQTDNPLRVRGRAKPGEIVQIFNYSTQGRALVAQTIADANGKFEVMANPADLVLGDKLGISSVTPEGKQSKVRLVLTDGYQHNGDPSQALPVAMHERAPYVQVGQMSIENASFDAAGKVLPGGPRWKIAGGDFSVEPLSKVRITSQTAEGRPFSVEVRADEEGKFNAEFPAMGFADFKITVFEDGGKATSVPWRTPGLGKTEKITGSSLNELANGVVTFHLPGGDVRGVVVDHSYQQHVREENQSRIPEKERTDNFVDVVMQLGYRATYATGTRDETYFVRVKIAKDEAEKFTARVNERIRISSPVLDTLPVDVKGEGNEIVERRFLGDAIIKDRDYLLQN